MHLPGYNLLECIYTSPKTRIFKGQALSDNTPVIVKTLGTDYPSSTDIGKLRREYTICRQLNINGIVRSRELISTGEIHAIIFEDIAGTSLDRIIRETTLDLETILTLVIDITRTLEEIHSRNIIHKDIKPSNIIFNQTLHIVKITDFRIASNLAEERHRYTIPDNIEGTIAYMAPEQTGRINRSVDHRTDLYSLGVLFYELLTGSRPFPSSDPFELIHSHIAVTPEEPADKNKKIPAVLSAIVMKLLAKNAEDRYQNGYSLQKDLLICLEQYRKNASIQWFPLSHNDISAIFHIPEKLYGREEEFSRLLDSFNTVLDGKKELVLVTGAPGIGKTMLVSELHKLITIAKGYFAEGKFDQLRSNTPYAGFIQVFQDIVKHILAEGEQAITNWKKRIVTAVGSNGQVIIDVIPEVKHIIGEQPALKPLPPGQIRNRFNMVFTRFCQALTSPEHPLVFFLDDLQWADTNSLHLLEVLLKESELTHFLIIGAYRNNEIGPSHPLTHAIKDITDSGLIPREICLGPLLMFDLVSMLSDMFSEEKEKLSTLADIVMAKTNGNPFFTGFLLQNLYRQNLFIFDTQNTRRWTWDIAAIKSVAVTENVVDFMCSTIRELSEKEQHLLQNAAVTGNQFDLKTLAGSTDNSIADVSAQLWPLLQKGLIIPLDEAYKYVNTTPGEADKHLPGTEKISYRFAHDRIQQAAYLLIPEKRRTELHLKIGRNMLQQKSEENLYDTVRHLNLGSALINQQDERLSLARLNLIMARKARESTAYNTARDLSRTGIIHLGPDCWEKYHLLCYDLTFLNAECEYLTGGFDKAESLLNTILLQARSKREKALVFELKTLIYSHLDKRNEALQAGLAGLQILGEIIPVKPHQRHVAVEFSKAFLAFGIQNPDNFLTLPEMTDPDKQLISRILMPTITAAYFVEHNMFEFLCMRGLNLSFQHGLNEYSSFMLIAYAVALADKFMADKKALKFMELAYKLNELYPNNEMQAKVETLFSFMFSHRHAPFSTGMKLLKKSFLLSVEAGDFVYAALCTDTLTHYLFASGNNLAEQKQEMKSYSEFVHKIEDHFSIELHALWNQLLKVLTGNKPRTSLGDDEYDEQQTVQKATEQFNANFLYHHFAFKAFIAFLFGDYKEACRLQKTGNQYAYGAALLPIINETRFYHCIAISAGFTDQSVLEKSKNLFFLLYHLRWMKQLSQLCPENFQHKYFFLSAETARITGRFKKATKYYNKAINTASRHGYLHHVAIFNERTAAFFQHNGLEKVAQTYLTEAHYFYSRWGAISKVTQLEKLYPHQLYPKQPVSVETERLHSLDTKTTVERSSTLSHKNSLDLMSVMKASQEISKEVMFDNLLEKLMWIVLENAGAQRGLLLISENNILMIKAESIAETGNVITGINQKAAGYNEIPHAVIEYVSRTHETIVLDDAAENSLFKSDPYLKKNQLRSLLCLPIIRHTQLTGILYLENNAIIGAFTKDRVGILNILATQIAISLENAALYSNLEDKVKERTHELYEAMQKIKHLSNTDTLTNIPNRRYFYEKFGKEWERANRYNRPLTFLMLDIDHFKSINDTWGHQTGDVVLKQLAQLLAKKIRNVDILSRLENKEKTPEKQFDSTEHSNILGRLGGEEFAVLLPETPHEGAQTVANRLRETVENTIFSDPESQQRIPLTISIGCCSVKGSPYPDKEIMYSIADQCLYQAKNQGRNRVISQLYAPNR